MRAVILLAAEIALNDCKAGVLSDESDSNFPTQTNPITFPNSNSKDATIKK